MWFPKKKTIRFSRSELSKLHKQRPNFACDNYIFPKTRGNKNKRGLSRSSNKSEFALKDEKNLIKRLNQASLEQMRANRPWWYLVMFFIWGAIAYRMKYMDVK